MRQRKLRNFLDFGSDICNLRRSTFVVTIVRLISSEVEDFLRRISWRDGSIVSSVRSFVARCYSSVYQRDEVFVKILANMAHGRCHLTLDFTTTPISESTLGASSSVLGIITFLHRRSFATECVLSDIMEGNCRTTITR